MEMLNLQKGDYGQDTEGWSDGLDAEKIWEPDDEGELDAALETLESRNPQALVIKTHMLSDERMATLLMSGDFSKLEVLNLHACDEVGDYTAAAIGSAELPNLKRVCLNWTKVSDKGLLLLAKKRGDQLSDLQGIHLAQATKVGLLQVHGCSIPNAHVTCPAD